MFLLFSLSSILGLYGLPSSQSLPLLDADYTSLTPRRADFLDTLKCTDERSKWTITRSCLLTIIACTWTAIHPNIGAPRVWLDQLQTACLDDVLRLARTRDYGDVGDQAIHWRREDHESV